MATAVKEKYLGLGVFFFFSLMSIAPPPFFLFFFYCRLVLIGKILLYFQTSPSTFIFFLFL